MIDVKALVRVALAVSFVTLPGATNAQLYPDRPVKIIVPYSAGSAPDLIGRIIGENLGRVMKSPFFIENRVGAGGKIGLEAAANSIPDGYSLLLGNTSTHGIMVHLYPGWAVDPQRDFVPISLLARIEVMLAANNSLPVADARQLIAYAKSSEQPLLYGSPGPGTNIQLVGEMLRQQYGVNMTDVPFSRNWNEVIPALLRGDVKLAVLGVPFGIEFVQNNNIKALAVTGVRRSMFLPSVPTFGELGLKGFEYGGWYALFAPKGTPPAVVQQLAAAVAEMDKTDEFRQQIARLIAEPAISTPEELSTLVSAETARIGELLTVGRR